MKYILTIDYDISKKFNIAKLHMKYTLLYTNYLSQINLKAFEKTSFISKHISYASHVNSKTIVKGPSILSMDLLNIVE